MGLQCSQLVAQATALALSASLGRSFIGSAAYKVSGLACSEKTKEATLSTLGGSPPRCRACTLQRVSEIKVGSQSRGREARPLLGLLQPTVVTENGAKNEHDPQHLPPKG